MFVLNDQPTMPIQRTQRVIGGALALWLFFLATSATLRHAHAHSQIPHHHGLGFRLLCLSAGGNTPTQAEGAQAPHMHVMVLGFELEGADCPQSSRFPADHTPHWLVGLITCCDPPQMHALTPAPGHLSALDLPAPSELPTTAELLDSSVWRFPRTPEPAALCVQARGERSGVLRI